jgi:hypothetical protein
VRLAQPIETKQWSWLRGVDLNPSSALIPRKLLIPRYAKTAQLVEKANLFYTFFTLCLLLAHLAAARSCWLFSPFRQRRTYRALPLTLRTILMVSRLSRRFN